MSLGLDGAAFYVDSIAAATVPAIEMNVFISYICTKHAAIHCYGIVNLELILTLRK